MTKTKFTPEQKIQIVLESIKTNISMAELCRKHNVHPPTFQTWRQQFLDAGKARLAHHGNADPTEASKKRDRQPQADYRRTDNRQQCFKKTLEESRD